MGNSPTDSARPAAVVRRPARLALALAAALGLLAPAAPARATYLSCPHNEAARCLRIRAELQGAVAACADGATSLGALAAATAAATGRWPTVEDFRAALEPRMTLVSFTDEGHGPLRRPCPMSSYVVLADDRVACLTHGVGRGVEPGDSGWFGAGAEPAVRRQLRAGGVRDEGLLARAVSDGTPLPGLGLPLTVAFLAWAYLVGTAWRASRAVSSALLSALGGSFVFVVLVGVGSVTSMGACLKCEAPRLCYLYAALLVARGALRSGKGEAPRP